MELIIKETGYVKKEACKKEPVFKIENGVLIDCNLNDNKTLTIPADVKIIDKMCFASTDVEELILPEGIEVIEARAFANCTKLKKINFPGTLNAIKDKVFLNCGSLTEVVLPETLEEMGNFAFYNSGIKRLTLPKRTSSTGFSVFGSIKIEIIDIPKDFKLNKAMFTICQNLHTVNFEADWVTIPEKCFYCCTNLTKIDISKALFIKDSAFLKCQSLSVDTISAYTYVGLCAFSETGATDVTIEDISKINERVFAECKSLKKLTINVTDGLAAINMLSVPKGLARECINLQTVIFTGHTENLSIIKEAAFRNTEMLTEINLPDNICLIEKYAFCNSSIKSIHLPENLEQIGIGAFAMSGLETITVPDKVTKLGKGVFKSCYKLTEAALPESVTAIPDEAFLNCHKLKTVHTSGVSIIGVNAFFNCKALEAFDFGQVKELESGSFAGTGICNAVFSSKLSKLQPSIFCDCKSLKTVDMSACKKIKTISARCFEGCINLSDVKLPSNVHKFSDDCFESVKFDRLVIKPGMHINCYVLRKTVINELEFADDIDSPTKTVVDLYAFENAKIGRLIIPDHMYDRFEEAIAKMR